MIEVGLIGFGLAGRAFHAPVIRAVPGLHLAAILQRSGAEAAEKYPDVRIVRSVDELLAIPEIRLVVIATPNETHYPFARQCLEAGRDVVVDKPFTTILEDAVSLVEIAKNADRLLTVYQNRRYDGDFQALRQLVAAGTLGRIVRFETTYDRYRPQLKPSAWREASRPGSGILFDIAPHLIDHALVLFGLPEAVTADVRIERENAVADDAFDITLHYANSLRAVLRSCILAAAPRPRFVVLGTQGSFVKQSFDPQETNLRHGNIPVPEIGLLGIKGLFDKAALRSQDDEARARRGGENAGTKDRAQAIGIVEGDIEGIVRDGVFTLNSNVGRHSFRQPEEYQRVVDEMRCNIEEDAAPGPLCLPPGARF